MPGGFLVLVLAALAVCPAGCATDAGAFAKLRAAEDPRAAGRNLGTVLAALDKETSDAATRAVGFESAAVLARTGNTRREDPALYARLLDALSREIASPKVDPLSKIPDDDRDFLRAWAVYCLGELRDAPATTPLVLGALENPQLAGDKAGRLHAAALHGLCLGVDHIRQSPDLRGRTLTLLPSARALAGAAEGAEIVRLADYLDAELRSLGTITGLLSEYQKIPPKEPVLLAALRNEYTLLSHLVLSKDPRTSAESYQANIAALAAVAQGNSPAGAARARVILGEFAPVSLAKVLLAKEKLPPAESQEPIEQLANLWGRLGEIAPFYASASAGAYLGEARTIILNESALLRAGGIEKLRQDCLAAVYRWLNQPQTMPQIGHVVAFLHDAAPYWLADWCVRGIESEKQRQNAPWQEFYGTRLGNLLAGGRLEGNDELRQRALQAMSALAGAKAASVRSLAAAYLLEKHPGVLLSGVIPVVREAATLPAADAAQAVEACVRALNRHGEMTKPGALPEGWDTALAAALRCKDATLCSQIVAALADRKPEVAAGALSARLRAPWGKGLPLEEWAAVQLLGDLLLSGKLGASDAAMKEGVQALAQVAPAADEEAALQIIRYLAALGSPGRAGLESLRPHEPRLSQAARAFLRLALEAPAAAAKGGAR